MKLLTGFDGNPKVLNVGLAGAGLYARALAYCGHHETDGFIPESWVRQAVAYEGLTELPKQMLSNGLWEREENGRSGYLIRDYLEVNRSKEQMDSLRESRSVAGKKGGEAKSKQKKSKSHSYSNSPSKSSSKRQPDPSQLPVDADSRIADAARRCQPILQRVAEARGGRPATLLAVYRACESYPAKPHVQVAGEVEHWTVHGNGRTRPAKDIVARFRNFLDSSADEVRVTEANSMPSPYEARVIEVTV